MIIEPKARGFICVTTHPTGSDFTNNTKQVLTRIRLREYNKRMGK